MAPALRDADQGEAVDVCRFHHRFEVSHLRGQGQVGRTSSALRVKRMVCFNLSRTWSLKS